jgi:hypothetical protein
VAGVGVLSLVVSEGERKKFKEFKLNYDEI